MATTSALGIVSEQMQALLEARRKQAGKAVDWPSYEFRVVPSCPPDTRIHIRGGLLWNVYPGDGFAWQLPSSTVDIADSVNIYGSYYGPIYDETQNYEIMFDTAYYYRCYTLMIKMPYDGDVGIEYRLMDLRIPDEFETAAEAEDAWADTVNDDMEAWYQGFPLCGLILRNNGLVATAGAIQPIDRINRGRSYLWPVDCRPQEYLA